jgi:hypothetical protein
MTTPLNAFSPWSGVKGLFPQILPQWLPESDRDRVVAYGIYDQMYWNHPTTYKIKTDDNQEIYLPSPRILIEAINRFLLPNFGWAIDPASGTPNDQLAVSDLLTSIFTREQFRAKFKTQRRFGLVKGDCMWHLIADPGKAEGTRISLLELDPSSYFPITDPQNDTRVIGCYIVTLVWADIKRTKQIVQRQWYQKIGDQVWSQLGYYETTSWDERPGSSQTEIKAAQPPEMTLTPEAAAILNAQMTGFFLPAPITSLPVYHIKNFRTTNQLYGSSQLRGFEAIFQAINQTITDEDITLAMNGIGMYATNSSPPVDDNGLETAWRLGPARVVEYDAGSTWDRVSGATDLSAFKQHHDMLFTGPQQAMGIPDLALGYVDKQIAESGISLMIKMGPLLAQEEEKSDELLSVYDHMFYDMVNQWLPAYEGVATTDVIVAPIADDPMPVNREAKIAEIIQLVASQLISLTYGRSLLVNYGYEVPDDMEAQVNAERAKANLASDPLAGRIAEDLAMENANASSGVGGSAGAPAGSPNVGPPVTSPTPPVGG